MRPTVSVIIPTYNRPARLRECLQAITRQTYTDFEIIVVNDGGASFDDVLKPFAAWPVFLIDLARRDGQVIARQRGVERARGRYIALCDDDDLWLPEHLGHLVQAAEAGTGLAYSDCEIVLFAEAQRGRIPLERQVFAFDYSLELLRHWNFIPPSTALYRRELHAELGKFDLEMADYWDWDWWLRIAGCHRVQRIPAATVLVAVDAGGDNASANPEAMADNLARLCAKHGLGKLPTSNFYRMLREADLQTWRRASKLVWDGNLPV